MNVRAQAVGMCSQFQNVANLVVNQFFPIFLTKCGFYAFYMFAGINILLAAFVFFFIPETRRVKLEEIDVLFGGNNHVEKGANLMGMPSRDLSVAEQGRGGHADEIQEVSRSRQGDDVKEVESRIENITSPAGKIYARE